MTADHLMVHVLCEQCWDERHPDEDPVFEVQDQAERCCWCGNYTRLGLTEEAPAEDVPRHRRDPDWVKRAHLEVPQDPREIKEDQ